MPNRRNLRIDLLALALLGGAGMLALSLVTYDPADDLSRGRWPASLVTRDVPVWPLNETLNNRCGFWGALTAEMVLATLGWSAYLTPAMLAIPGWFILRRSPPEMPWLRVAGVFGAVIAGCTLAEQIAAGSAPGPVVGAGGRLGAVMRMILADHLGGFGGFLAAGGILIGGLILALDQSVLTALRVALFGAKGVGRVGSQAIRNIPRGVLLRQFAEGRLATVGASRTGATSSRRMVASDMESGDMLAAGGSRSRMTSFGADDLDEEPSDRFAASNRRNAATAPAAAGGGLLGLLTRSLGMDSTLAGGRAATKFDDDAEEDGRRAGPLRMQSDLVAPKRQATRLSVAAERRLLEEEDDQEDEDDYEADVPARPAARAAGVRGGSVVTRRDDDHGDTIRPVSGRGKPTGRTDLDRPSFDDEEEELEIEEPIAVVPEAPPARPDRRAAAKQDEAAAEALRESVMEELDEANVVEQTRSYVLPSVNLLKPADSIHFAAQEGEVREKAAILEQTLGQFGFQVKVVAVETGPVIAQYELKLEAGLRLAKITGLAEDLAIALCVPSVRIVAPLPGKNTVGVEVPNTIRRVVRLREVFEESRAEAKKMHIPIFLGKGVAGDSVVLDLAKMPHLLIAGATGTGKSVCLNSIIASILMTRRPDEVRMLLLDPKKVELSPYGTLPHLMHPVVTETREKAEPILAWAVDKMEERYTLLAKAGVRHIASYNQLGEEELMRRLRPEDEEEAQTIPRHLPFLVLVLDEFADMMQEDKAKGKEIESHIIRLAQKSRAVGIHLILATQRPTVDVITGLIKSNLPSRISFKVSSRTDSRVILDEQGADKLLGDGDLLFLTPGRNGLTRGQGTYCDDEEIQSLIKFVSQTEPQFVEELMNLQTGDAVENSDGKPITLKKRDDLYEQAVEVVVQEKRGSVSLLQRNLGIGYGRAARLIDYMAEDGIVGPYNGQNAREVMLSQADWDRMKNGDTPPEPPKEPAAPLRISIGPHKAYHAGKEKPEPSGRYLVDPEDDEDHEPAYATGARASFDDDETDDESDDD